SRRPAGLAVLKVGESAWRKRRTVLSRMSKALRFAPLAMEKCARRERAGRESSALRSLLGCFPSFMSLQTPNEVARQIVEILADRLGFARALAALREAETGDPVVASARGFAAGAIGVALPAREGSLADWLKGRRVVLIDSSTWADRPPNLPPPGEAGRQTAFLPLELRGELLGLAIAETAGAPAPASSVSTLTVLAQFAAQAIHNARVCAEIEHRAETDSLTGIYNRYFFERALQMEIALAKRYRHPLSLLMADICNLKRINDACGHLVGDEILKTVGSLLASNVRTPDIVARFGGDEFVVLMPNTSLDQARLALERIERSIQAHNDTVADGRLRFQISMGLKSAADVSVERILFEADEAMYEQKKGEIQRRLLESLVAGDEFRLEPADKTVASVLKAFHAKEPFYCGHARRVMDLAVRLAKQLRLSETDTETIALAALLHDIGKVAIHPDILTKPGPLTVQEFELVKTHPVLADDLLSGIERLDGVKACIHAHHERFDGRTRGPFPGYPEGWARERIPLGARILKLADAFDAMTSRRPYREPISVEAAFERLVAERGRSFDPTLVDAFLDCFK
ncbi:MAG: diguanylate cyclase, partial [Candidatus Sumerlaeota bacterium]|nr:diguanylate cyclase [Candidatus Sumerlaeota bacterium]